MVGVCIIEAPARPAPAEEPTEPLVACRFVGVEVAPAARCRSDVAGRFVPAVEPGVGNMPWPPEVADGEGSISRRGRRAKKKKKKCGDRQSKIKKKARCDCRGGGFS